MVKTAETVVKKTPQPMPKAVTPTEVAASLPLAAAVVPDVRHRIVRPVELDPRRKRMWIVAAVAAVVLLVLLWRLMRSEPASNANAASQPISTLASPQPGDTPAPASVPKTKPSAAVTTKGKAAKTTTAAVTPPPANAAASPNPSVVAYADPTTPAAHDSRVWRVVAYTFNLEDQAQKKADSLAKRDASLNPQVFSPNGHAPYLVTIGGQMTRDQAEALKQKARSSGLPQDTYAQNYTH